MENFFVPYEQALALKELGFNQKCLGQFNIHQGNKWLFNIDLSGEGQYSLTTSACIAPLYEQAFKFFREKYKLYQYIEPVIVDETDSSIKYDFIILDDSDDTEEYDNIPYNTFEEAELECLNKLIEIVKTKKYAKHTFNTNKKKK